MQKAPILDERLLHFYSFFVLYFRLILFIFLNMPEPAPRGIAINSEAAFRNQQLDFFKTMRIKDIRNPGLPDGIADDRRLIAAEDDFLQMRTAANDATH